MATLGRPRFERRPRRGVLGFGSPLPLQEIQRLEVRVGNSRYGALLGAGAGLLIATGALAQCGASCDTGTSGDVAVYLGITLVTTVVGAMIGRDGWGWTPIYRAPRRDAAAAMLERAIPTPLAVQPSMPNM